MSEPQHTIQIENLEHRFGTKVALSNISWRLPQKGIVGLVGPNGAGKTTLFSLIAGFLRVQSGKIKILGSSSPGQASLAGRMGVMPQDAIFAKDISILDQLLYLLKLDGITGASAESRVFAIMKRVGLEKEIHRGASTLSHGMGKRLGVAQSLLGLPEIVLLDEPTAGLDPANARQIREFMREVGKSALVIVSSHNLIELQDLIDEVGVIVDGKLVASGTVEEVTQRDRRFEVTFGVPVTPEMLVQIDQLDAVQSVNFDSYQMSIDLDASGETGLDQALLTLQQKLVDLGTPAYELREGASLEQAYMRLTSAPKNTPEE
ncbi:MAG: ATP-binding cassette domain-containing protein [Proteobacteria bacterium]|nr:ATP-binding cassette domain-containing protein [Pseudomonadota bacterium]